MNQSSSTIEEAVEGKIFYLLILVVLAQFTYPFSVGESITRLILYQILFTSVIFFGIAVARDHSILTRLLIFFSVLWLASGVYFAFNPEVIWVQLISYITIAPFESLIIFVLLRFIFQAKQVTRDVLYSATAVYVLLGAVFVPIYGFLETVNLWATGNHAFIDSVLTVGERFPWQTFVYLSYASLTTLGLGDVLPATFWARSLVTFEAVLGVLYVTIIMARLVGLYATGRD